jgi:hypothetical protein
LEKEKVWAEDSKDKDKAEKMTQEYIKNSNIRICKRCGNAIVKASGCLKMKCRCGYRFCFKCGSENA